jgi:hypothetical protein
MNICNYCHFTNGVSADLPILQCEADYGLLGNGMVSVLIKRDSYGGTFLDLTLDNYGLGSSTLRKLQPVNFCPICGRKINVTEANNYEHTRIRTPFTDEEDRIRSRSERSK